jgi:hypothetical protein
VFHLGKLLALATNIKLGCKACKRQTLKLIKKIVIYGRKKFFVIDPRGLILIS